MRPDGLHHVSINVSDVGAARDFYTRVLGLTERSDRPDFSFDGAWLDVGGQQVHLIEAEVPPELGQHFALAVTDPVPVGPGRQAFVTDPSGNRVELQQPPAAR